MTQIGWALSRSWVLLVNREERLQPGNYPPPFSARRSGRDVALGAARAGVGLAGSAGEGGASGAGAAVWPPAIVKDARRAIHVAFNLAALFMRQPCLVHGRN
jgi:hypothetical protein